MVLVADHQTAGRGRRSRPWTAPAGASLLVSVLLRPTPERATLCTFVAGVAMVDAVEAVCGAVPRLKWPNDLVVGDRKLGGILAEAAWSGADDVAVVVGVGLNVDWPVERPDDLLDTAVALNDVVGECVDREDLLTAWLERLERRWPPDPPTLLDEWRARSATLRQPVRVELEARSFEGIAIDVTEAGELVVEHDGRTSTVSAGDVVHLRPA
jgi:BirA family transcriptional regulator, biotin operon repressor / biotin---[acetyl-CoA-carboxylase] ligase